MATSKSSLGENRVPKPSNQGSSAPSRITPKRVSSNYPGGHLVPVAGKSVRKQPQATTPRGGSGTGARKGDSLPR